MKLAHKEYEDRRRAQRIWLRIALSYLVLVPLVCVLSLVPIQTIGQSMFPCIVNGDRIIFSETLGLSRFDVVMVQMSNGNLYCKRVVGLPGDHLKFTRHSLILNGKTLREYYIHDTPSYERGELRLGEDQYFVLGDNRNVSLDSRAFGPVSRDQIKGRMLFRIWRSHSSQSASR